MYERIYFRLLYLCLGLYTTIRVCESEGMWSLVRVDIDWHTIGLNRPKSLLDSRSVSCAMSIGVLNVKPPFPRSGPAPVPSDYHSERYRCFLFYFGSTSSMVNELEALRSCIRVHITNATCPSNYRRPCGWHGSAWIRKRRIFSEPISKVITHTIAVSILVPLLHRKRARTKR